MDAFWYTHHNGVCHMCDGLKTTLDVSAEKRAVVEIEWLAPSCCVAYGHAVIEREAPLVTYLAIISEQCAVSSTEPCGS